jgi:N-acetylglucosamine kinase-like BadF-type ATPase
VKRYLIGIDGGGSRSKALLADRRDDMAEALVDGPGLNPLALDWNDFRGRISGLLSRLLAEAPPGRVDGLCAGLAGTGREVMRKRAEEEILALGGGYPVTVMTDAQAGLWGAFRGGPGLLLIAGTGSVCLGMEATGRQERAGGFGRLIGDEGSGYWIAMEAIRRALREDDRQRISPLAALVKEEFHLTELRDVIPVVHSPDCPPDCLAALARQVLEASGTMPEAGEIVRRAGEHLAGLVVTTARKLGMEHPRVALWGGLWQSPRGELQSALDAALRAIAFSAEIAPPAEPPEWGAVRYLQKSLKYKV